MIDPFGSRAFDRGNTDVLSQILGGGDAEKELLLIRQALVEFFFFQGACEVGSRMLFCWVWTSMDDFVSLGPLFFSLPEEVMQCACNYTMAMAHVLDFFDLYVVQCIHIKSYKLFFTRPYLHGACREG